MEILQIVKCDPKLSMIPFLIFSGGSDERVVRIAQGLGVAAYLIKTVAIPALLTTIAHFLNPNASLAKG